MVKFAQMPKYEAYKDSGVEWLGEIPTEWSVLANKHIFKLKKNLVGKRSKEYVLLSLTLKGIIKRDMENPEGKFPAEFDTYQEVNEGDFVFCLFDVEETPRTVGLSPFYGMITGAYTVFEPAPEFDRNFLYYFYLNLDAEKRLKPLYTGLRNTISKDAFLSFKTFVPTLDEQGLIANFLDQKTAQIDAAIAIKEQQIELLKERKQIIIQQAVTQGLDPNVPMKDSGVEWIGQIPEHWMYEPIKYSLKGIIDCEHKTAPFVDEEEYFVVRTTNVKDAALTFSGAKYTTEKGFKEWTRRGVPAVGDVLLTREAPAGEACVIPSDLNLCLGQRMVWLKVDNTRLLSEFAVALIYSTIGRTYIDFLSSGSTVLHLNMADIGNIPVLLPPIEEQYELVHYISELTDETNRAIKIQAEQIQKLKEYKTTLINSAVTGKIKITPELLAK